MSEIKYKNRPGEAGEVKRDLVFNYLGILSFYMASGDQMIQSHLSRVKQVDIH